MSGRKLFFSMFFACLGTLFPGRQGFAQDYKAEFAKVREAYSQLKSFSTDIQVTVRMPSGKMLQVGAAIRKQGDEFRYTVNETIYLVNKHFVLTVHQRQKKILVKKRGSQSTKWQDIASQATGFSFDSLLKTNTVQVQQKGTGHYVVTLSDAAIPKAEVFFNTQYLLTKVIYHYNPNLKNSPQQATVEFRNLQQTPLPSALFQEEEFIQGKGETYRGAGAYQSYQVTFIKDPKP